MTLLSETCTHAQIFFRHSPICFPNKLLPIWISDPRITWFITGTSGLDGYPSFWPLPIALIESGLVRDGLAASTSKKYDKRSSQIQTSTAKLVNFWPKSKKDLCFSRFNIDEYKWFSDLSWDQSWRNLVGREADPASIISQHYVDPTTMFILYHKYKEKEEDNKNLWNDGLF